MYSKYLVPIALLIATPAALAATPPVTQQQNRISQIDRVAKKISVRIEAYNNKGEFTEHGSGVLVSRQKNVYTLLTADHVLHYRAKDGSKQLDGKIKSTRFKIVTADGNKYSIEPNSIRRQSVLDLATFKISSNKSYQLASIAATDRVAYSFSDRDWTFVAGYPDPTKFNRKPEQWLWYTSVGSYFTREQNFFATKNNNSSTAGYELVYNNLTYGGMSGGAVLNSQGQLIGIHGRQENLATGYGLSLGIPIGVFNSLTNALGVDSKALNYQAVLPALSSQENKILNAQVTQRQKTELSNTPAATTEYQWLSKGVQQIRIGQTDSALTSLNNAIKLQPNLAAAYYTRGMLFSGQNKQDAAVKEFDRAIQSCREYQVVCISALREKSLKAIYNGDYAIALSAIDKAIELDAEEAYLYDIKGDILTKLKRFPAAITSYNKAIALSPNPYFYYDRGIAYYQSGNKQQGIADFKETFKRNPNAVQLYMATVSDLYKVEDPIIIDTLSAIITLRPQLVEAYIYRGNAYRLFYQNSLSKLDYQTAKKLFASGKAEFIYAQSKPAQAKHEQLILAAIYKSLEEYPQALAIYNRAIVSDAENPRNYINRGSLLAKLDRYPAALLDYNRAIEIAPDDATYYGSRSSIYEKLNRKPESVADLSRQIEILTQSNDLKSLASAYSNRSLKYFIAGNYAPALADSNRAIELNRTYGFAYHLRAGIYSRVGNNLVAIANETKYIELLEAEINPNFENAAIFYLIPAYAERGKYYQAVGKVAEAQADWQKSLTFDLPKIDNREMQISAYIARSWVNQNLERYTEAIANLNIVLKLDPKNADAYRDRGVAKVRLDRYSEAVTDLSAAIALDPNEGVTYFGRATAYSFLGKYSAALLDIDRALQLKSPSFSESQLYTSRARMYSLSGDLTNSIKDLDRAIKLQPLAERYGARGLAYSSLGQYDRAMQDLELAIQLEKAPTDKAEYISDRGSSYFQQGKYDLALADYNTTLQLDPKSTLNYLRLGRVYYKLGKYAEASIAIDTALKLDPKQASPYSVAAHSLMGKIYVKQNNLPQAKAARDRMNAINLDNRSTAIASSKHTNLGFLQYDLGEIENAMSNWNRSLKLNPGTNYESQLAIASVLYSQGKVDEAILLAKPILSRYPHLKNPQYLNQSLWSSELLVLANKMYSDRQLNKIIWNVNVKS
ncbi:serine protease [Chamaesiphon sp. GL140_3_metabinner_50]|uniref:serine protease n=1 Tax=Chamaesiphon sp. GL140_3_metabinner_50 TaxID=2970812 RepID=UPI0025EC74A7|nr:serine protease [Chamaesiphon sp. GL140_3_metabinner_50]